MAHDIVSAEENVAVGLRVDDVCMFIDILAEEVSDHA